MWMHKRFPNCAGTPNGSDRITPEITRKKSSREKHSEMTRCLRGILDGPNLEPWMAFFHKKAMQRLTDPSWHRERRRNSNTKGYKMIQMQCWSRNLGKNHQSDAISPNELPKKLPSSYCNSLTSCGRYFHFIPLLWQQFCWTHDEPACIHSPKCESYDPTHHPSPPIIKLTTWFTEQQVPCSKSIALMPAIHRTLSHVGSDLESLLVLLPASSERRPTRWPVDT